ncbi:MAG: hypothetical protein SV062_06635, partial [Thermodesulfobacteriota bacterium]|nr:hypothetical protein [Thermodesulfobacteriota bacterium]
MFLSILIKPAPAYAEMIEPREPDTAKSCAICHYIWVSTFYLKHKKSPVAPFPEKAEAGSKKMCLSCHDGSVRDSRDRIFNRPGHKVGIIPSKKVSVPSYLPLNEKGGIMCSTCHSPHNLPAEDGKKPFSFFRAKNIDSSFCKICHKSQIKGVDKGNHVLDRKPFSYPSKIIASGGILGKEDNIICQTCHLSHGGVSDQ